MATCYYPNGDPSPGDIPCSSGDDATMCCPLNWKCESNGLCSLANAGYYGRYTCTDKTWSSSNCPKDICTENLTAAGDEAVLQCSAGSYCCDTNRPDPGCCDTTMTRFTLDQLPIIAGGGSNAAASSATAAASSSTSIQALSSSSPTTFSTFSSAATSFSATTSAFTSITSDTASTDNPSPSPSASPSVKVIFITSVVGSGSSTSTLVSSTTSAVAALASASPSASSGSNHLASIVGPAVAVPTALLALAALAFFLFWRRRRGRKNQPETHLPHDTDNLQPMYGEAKRTHPAVEEYKGKPELEGSPQLGINGGHSPSTAPPSYRGVSGMSQSPNMKNYTQSPELDGSPVFGGAGDRGSRISELAATPVSASYPSPRASGIPENPQAEAEQEPSEPLSNTFRPYRPPGLGVVNT